MKTLNEQIDRLRKVLVTCYKAIKEKGGSIPEAGERNMTNLPAAVLSVPQTNGVLTELTVTANGEYLPKEGADGFSKVTARFYENIPHFEYKEVTFIDHLGVVADYTIEEAMALSVLPTPREYSHLTFDEWSMTLEEIQDGKPHTIAANYHTTNNEYRFGYTTEAGKKLIFSIFADGPCLVDFGNGDTITTNNNDNVEYTYNEDGEYNVVVNSLNGSIIKEISFTNSSNSVYGHLSRRGITYIEMPNTLNTYNCTTGFSGGFANSLPYLRYIVIPKLSIEIYYQIHSCVKCRFLALPNNVNEIRNIKGAFSVECMNIPKLVKAFNNTPFYNLRKIVFEGTCKSVNIGNYSVFTKCKIYFNEGVEELQPIQWLWTDHVVLPNTILSLPSFLFAYSTIDYIVVNGTPTIKDGSVFRDTTIKYVYFTSPTPPVIEKSAVFYNYKGIVRIPVGSLNAYRESTNWLAAEESGYFTFEEFDYENSKIE